MILIRNVIKYLHFFEKSFFYRFSDSADVHIDIQKELGIAEQYKTVKKRLHAGLFRPIYIGAGVVG